MICPICDAQGDNFKIYEIDCVFLPIPGIDQHLIRHQCPFCDVIFGTQQMLNLPKDKLKEAYQIIFDSGYRDGDESSVNMEIENLLALEPKYDGVYLNYGAGTSKVSEKAKLLGYNLIPYDPFTNQNFDDKILYDGIISHNLMEHLQDPIGELIKMKSLLKQNCFMVHSTPCYKYCYAFTKFHLFFFEGKSLDIISQKSGLKYEFINQMTVKFS